MRDERHSHPEEGHDHSILLLGMLSGSLVALLLWPQTRASFLAPASDPLPPAAISNAPAMDASQSEAAPSAALASPTPTEPMIRLLFTGDINPGRCPAQVALRADDFTIPYQFVAEELRSADITVGSLDGSISDMAPPEPCPVDHAGVSNLIGPARTVEGLFYAGFDVVSVATNHALDCGSLGWRCDGKVLEDTRRILLGEGILPAGIGETVSQARAPVIVERQGVRFAFLAVNAVSGEATWASETQPGTAPLSTQVIQDVAADIAAARRLADVVIVLPHWGVEYEESPQADERAWAVEMIAAGADLVIGNHPHVIQPVETYSSGGVVAYALGNFVFDQGPLRTRQGVVFEAVFRGSELVSWQLLPLLINASFQPHWADPAEAAAILSRVDEATRELISH